MIRPAYFIWIVVPVTLYLAFLAFGLPHFAWSYSWRDDGQGYDPFRSMQFRHVLGIKKLNRDMAAFLKLDPDQQSVAIRQKQQHREQKRQHHRNRGPTMH